MNDQTLYLKEHFEEIKQKIREKYEISDIAYDTWLSPLKFIKILDHKVFLGIPPEIAPAKSHIASTYSKIFEFEISEALETPVKIQFTQGESLYEEARSEESAAQEKSFPDSSDATRRHNLNPHYTFDTFIVGKNNNIAQATSLAVAERPGKAFNPLFLYSDAGLGKTHLMHSIGNYILDHDPDARVLYVTSEVFTNEVIASIRSNNPHMQQELRRKYRDVDVLMVDDIQFIIGKESTQEEFFHTFNQLHDAGKQIVISSDKPPKDMVTLEERFRSRFEWGMIADIQPPDYETRMAILQKNAENYPGHIDDDVFAYIAENVKSNIRELEGAFNKITAHAAILGESIDLPKAQEVLKDIISERDQLVTPQTIIDKICSYYSISKEDIISQKRSRDIAKPRQVAMYFIRSLTDTSYEEIGKVLGDRDHTTVMSGIGKISNQLQTDKALAEEVENIRQMIKPNV